MDGITYYYLIYISLAIGEHFLKYLPTIWVCSTVHCLFFYMLSLPLSPSHFIIFKRISITWPVLCIVSYFNLSHSSGFEVVSDYSFSLHFSDDK